MPLANIAAVPNKRMQPAFDFSHYQDHLQIVQAINAQHAKHLPVYAIHPAPTEKDDTWLRLHQAFHNDMNSVLKTNGTDLTGMVDARWYDQNFREHTAARQQLGI